MFPIYKKPVELTPQQKQLIKLEKKKRKTILRGKNRFEKQTKVFNCMLETNRTSWKTLINFNESILNTFSKTNLTYNELKDLFDEVLEKENKKNEISIQQYNIYGNSKRFLESKFFVHTEKTRFDINLRIYTTGEVYFYIYRPCVYRFFVSSIEEFKNGFSLIDFMKSTYKEDFVIKTKFEKLCDYIFDYSHLFPRHEYGTNTKYHQELFIKDCINLFLTRHLRKTEKEKRLPMLFNDTYFKFYSDNKPNVSDVESYIKDFLKSNKLTYKDIIEDFLNFRKDIFDNNLRNDDYKKVEKDYPNFYCMFGELSEEKKQIRDNFHDKYKYDLDCVFDKLPLNNEELKEAKKIFEIL